jgi:DNA primase
MSGRIPQHFIDDLLARIDIVDLIDGFVPLRQSGQNFSALCPFHDEKTPSFTVNRDKQFYHCFGCNANGSAIGFLMEFHHLDFVSAVEELAGRAGLQVPYEGGNVKKQGEATELYELLELVVQFYQKQLREHRQSGRARDYLQQRGIADQLIAGFELGYAPAGWDNLINALGKSDAAKQRLLKAGLVIQRDPGSFYDRFRDRIIYPIRDQRGRAIGFGGRVIDDGTPKYLNSPETTVFHKGRELYGLYQARHAQKNLQRLYVVEGYMDVLALVGYGVTNTVATLGTAVTGNHLEAIFRNIPEVIFCFDGDEAGRRAAWRALETALPVLRDGRQAFFMFLPQGEDPDDHIRKQGREAFTDADKFLSLSDYLLQELTRDFNPAITEHKGNLRHKAKPYLKKMPHSSLRQLLIDKLAVMTGTDAPTFEQNLTLGNASPRRAAREAAPGRQDRKLLPQIIKLLLQEPGLALKFSAVDELESMNLPGTDFLVELLRLIHNNPGITCARIIEHWRGTRYEQRLSELAPSGQSRYSADDAGLQTPEYLETEFSGAIQQLRNEARKQRLVEFSQVTSTSKLSEEQKALLRGLNPAARPAVEK